MKHRARQLPLGLDAQAPPSLDGFIGAENLLVRALIAQQMSGSGEAQVLVHGAGSSGKTHLARAACFYAAEQGRRAGFVAIDGVNLPELSLHSLDVLVLDDIHRLMQQPEGELWLFDVINQARDRGVSLLLTSVAAPIHLGVTLPDLASRLAWGVVVRVAAPTEAEKLELLCRKALERGLTLPFEAALFILNHGARDVGSLMAAIDQLDVASLAAQRKLTVPFVRSVLFQPVD
ncbi:DnaA regulatory inactivator Hda [Halothiobacillus sp. DCM-1]|uniref:DnaA regulatory inactivator Hda n=1 Tax=Halothiobacillus sp. DCM-1 TaxID=3112558 RepID=UPI0032568114